MESYFFVPGDKLNKIDAIRKLEVDIIIIDLEDAVKESELDNILINIEALKGTIQNCYIRVPLFNSFDQLNTIVLERLITSGFTKFVLPKLNSILQFESLLEKINHEELELILLVETPNLLFECNELIKKHSSFFKGIGLGSHDLLSIIGGKHDLKNLEYARQHILYIARANNLIAIDVASMELNNTKLFRNEILDGFTKGYDAKFVIHPWQLEVLEETHFYSFEEYQWALKIDGLIKEASNIREFNAIRVDGQIIEKPHFNRVKKILKYYKRI